MEHLWPIIQQFIYILPLVGIVYKLGGVMNEHAKLKEDFEKAYELFCKKNEKFETKLEDERRATDSAITTIMAQLNSILITMTEIKTRVDLKPNDNN